MIEINILKLWQYSLFLNYFCTLDKICIGGKVHTINIVRVLIITCFFLFHFSGSELFRNNQAQDKVPTFIYETVCSLYKKCFTCFTNICHFLTTKSNISKRELGHLQKPHKKVSLTAMHKTNKLSQKERIVFKFFFYIVAWFHSQTFTTSQSEN